MHKVNLSEILGVYRIDEVDVSEPSFMDKVLTCVEANRREDEKFMQGLISKLDSMVITWDQPWYQKGLSLTRRLKSTEEQSKETESYHTDRFSKEEKDQVAKNWRKFRKTFDVPDTPICLARYTSRTTGRMPNTKQERVRHFVTSFLARDLKRTLSQVYRQFVSMYAYLQAGPITPLEEKVIQICINHCPKKAAPLLSYVLSRHPRQIYNRLKSRNECVERKLYPKWTIERATHVVNVVMKETGLQLPELKYKDIDKDVWRKVEAELNHPSVLVKTFWFKKLHVQLFLEEDLTMNRLRKRIFKKLPSYPYKVWTDIRWKEFVKEFPDGCTPLFIYTVAVKTFRDFKEYRKLPLDQVISYALARTSRKNWRVRRLMLDDKENLQPIDDSD